MHLDSKGIVWSLAFNSWHHELRKYTHLCRPLLANYHSRDQTFSILPNTSKASTLVTIFCEAFNV
jgi:hypothetical protein